jgi:putative ubiquitin-RnfH superfamily antitoxin RatB of RatAB toxin-antitoxin module
MESPDRVHVEVVYALPERQWLVELELAAGATARTAVLAAAEQGRLPDIDAETCRLGVFGKTVADGRVLADGDRVEIYRPLKADPKEVRRKLAAIGKTIGKKKR